MTAVVPAAPSPTSGSPRSFRTAMLAPGALVTFVLMAKMFEKVKAGG